MTVAVLGTAGAVIAGTPSLRELVVNYFQPATAKLVVHKVGRQKLVITVTERGNLESSKNEDVFNEVEGQTTILKILPEGSRVKKGDIVCELDSATLRDNLTNQQIATERAKADYENALKTREVAEIAKQEYIEGTYAQEQLNIKGERTLAENELTRAEERLAWSRRMLKSNYISEGQVLADEYAKMRAEISRIQAEKKAEVLENYTKKKQLTELDANIEKAKSDELAKLATYNLEKAKLEKLQSQIEKCIIRAPNDGLIVYGNDPNQFRGNNQPQIQEGAVVIQRQKIFSLPDVFNMQVNTKVHESMIDRVEPGQKAKIRVDAFAGAPLTGTVKSVQPLPDPTSFFSSDVKVYTTIVTIDQKLSSLRPGMTAEVTILIDTLDDVLCIPVTAVLPLKGKEYVYVVNEKGKPERREVKLGATNDILIEVKEGLKEGDLVAMNPTALLSESEKNEAFSAVVRASSKAKDFGDLKNPPKAEGESGGAEPAKAKARTKGAGGPGGFGGAGAAMFQKFRNISPEDREKLKTASEEEKKEIMRKAGFTDEELQQMEQMRQQMMQGGGGFGGGFGGGAFGGGGFGGPPGGAGAPGGGQPQ
ncbi:MAG: hypothetical protein KatS3mg108_2807 [Isosphaeraceae bacterium]|jgi:RND family efflux transporter MFP subunit|nr:MAG: hypothetical protein KatS3mg108_2807 [Isosphaeraceae bacterium]